MFNGDEKLEGKVDIQMSDALPKQQESRRVPELLREKLKCALNDLKKGEPLK